jgi:mono/diheme cytochrome c family protein
MRHSSLVALVLVTTTASLVAACSSNNDYDFGYGHEEPVPTTKPSSRPAAPPPKGPQPNFGTTVRAAVSPPPISGGTLLVLRDGRVIAADPDRDRLFVVNVESREVQSIALVSGDEPGRVVEDDAGRVHVVLRRGGAVVTVDPTAARVLARRDVCPSPRGLALSAAKDQVLVACEGGELVALPVDPKVEKPEATLVARLDRDLRDIVVTTQRIFVSRLRSAEVQELSPSFKVIARSRPWAKTSDRPMLAMRMIAPPEGDPSPDPIFVHEISRDPAIVQTGEPSYQGTGGRGTASTGLECGETPTPMVFSAVSRLGIGQGSFRAPDLAALPVDIAADARTIAMVAAGNGHTRTLPQIYTFANVPQAVALSPFDPGSGLPCPSSMKGYRVNGQAVAVAFRRANALVVQSREPAELELLPEKIRIPLSDESHEDTGHAIFHSNSGAGLACASCHVEGGDDGQLWTVDKNGPARTPSLRGTLAGTAPFHWRGDIADIAKLADAIMTGRMNGPQLEDDQKDTLRDWLFSIPAPNVEKTSPPAGRGRAVFLRKDVGCVSCHSGPRFTNSATMDVGTGGAFQVPSLVGISTHAPYLHNGCAATLRDRFGACGGNRHGDTSQLSSTELDDLVAYLETL